MINDLIIDDAHTWKYVDDTTASESVSKGGTSDAQNIVDQVVTWSSNNQGRIQTGAIDANAPVKIEKL